jgi:hypothetical protein
MFKILEFKGVSPAQATEVGRRYATREEAQAARNPESGYWWARDAEGLRKCWIPAPTEGRRRC